MRILHTADIHLSEIGDVRWAAFESVVRLAGESNASALVVSGDMFDRNAAAEGLKTAVRETLREKPFHVVLLPGNHDDRALKSGDYFGEKVEILDRPGSFVDIEGARILGLPFEKIDERKVIERLSSIKEKIKTGRTNILLYHGELLDKFFDRASYGGEEEYEYMPARLSYFKGLGLDYVLAGHFHTNFNVYAFEGGYFVYPGSPVSVTRKETSRRNVNLFDIGSPPAAKPLDTYHVEAIEMFLNPSSERNPIEEIKARLKSCHEMAEIFLTVSGHVDLEALGKNENEFAQALRAIEIPAVTQVIDNWKDVGEILHNDIFKRFDTRLVMAELPRERKEEIRSLVLEVFSEVDLAD